MLYIVPTPIGNLRDITLRALDVLKEADFIICEDSRQTGKLLARYEIKKPLVSFHEHTGESKRLQLVKRLQQGETAALVTDAGMPLISDPGFEIIHELISKGIALEVLPGPQAAVTALVGSGLATDSFAFFGFLPVKSARRRKEIERVSAYEETLIFYESPHRLLKSLGDLEDVLGDREAAVGRELTKKFEDIQRGRLSELKQFYENKPPKGEIVLLVAGAGRKPLLPGS